VFHLWLIFCSATDSDFATLPLRKNFSAMRKLNFAFTPSFWATRPTDIAEHADHFIEKLVETAALRYQLSINGKTTDANG
jgi:hypothetical protein